MPSDPTLIPAAATAFTILAALVVVLVLWIVTSFPLYLMSKVVVHERSQFVRALIATFLGSVVFLLFLSLFSFIFIPLGIIVGFIGILAILSFVYRIGLGQALVLSVLTIAAFLVLFFLLALIGITVVFIHFL